MQRQAKAPPPQSVLRVGAGIFEELAKLARTAPFAWLCVRSTVGVASMICRDNRPVPVPAGIVEGLIAQTDATNVTRLDSGLALGAPVRILSGPFAQLVGTLERLDDAGRVRVLLNIMGTAVPVALQRAALAPAV